MTTYLKSYLYGRAVGDVEIYTGPHNKVYVAAYWSVDGFEIFANLPADQVIIVADHMTKPEPFSLASIFGRDF